MPLLCGQRGGRLIAVGTEYWEIPGDMFGWQGEKRSQHGWDSEKNNLAIVQLAARVSFLAHGRGKVKVKREEVLDHQEEQTSKK